MNAVNIQTSVTNQPLFDRHQNEVHRTPVDNQAVNSQMSKEESARRTEMPVQPDHVDSKIIDPADRRREQERRRKKQNCRPAQPRLPRDSRDGGRFVDLSA